MSSPTDAPSVAEIDAGQIPEPQRAPDPATDQSRAGRLLRELTAGSALLTVLAVAVSLMVGAVLIALTDPQVAAASAYFAARPTATFAAIGAAVGGAYTSLIQGGVYDWTQPTFVGGIASLFTSLNFATPLIAAGLGIGIGFRAGVFNIGGQGQMLVGGAVAGWIGFAFAMPPVVHLVVAVVAGIAGGALYAAIAGLLKAMTGAHEVIVTIMLNYIAYYFISYLLTNALKAPRSSNPISPAELPTATFPGLLGSLQLNLAFLIVVVLTAFSWWLLDRSSLGFQFRAVGANPHAARVAGMSLKRLVILTMVISGALVAFAGVYQVLGQTTTGFGHAFDAGLGFNAITVALLGRNRPWGIFAAGILFGVFQSGGYDMQAAQGIDINIVLVLQSIIVLFIAAPPLVRAIFRLPQPGMPTRPRAGGPRKAAAS